MVTTTIDRRGPWESIAEIRAANERAGFHFFEKPTMRFFDSRIERTVYGGRFFLTSEAYDGERSRRWTVRAALDDGDIRTMGEFNKLYRWEAQEQAKDYAKRLRNGETVIDSYGHEV